MKKRTFNLLLIGIIVILSISMVGAVSAYSPTYNIEKVSTQYAKYDNLNIYLNPEDISKSGGTYNTTINLGNGKKVNIHIETKPTNSVSAVYNYMGGSLVHVSTADPRSCVYVKITSINTPKISYAYLYLKSSPNDYSLYDTKRSVSGQKINNQEIIFEAYRSESVKPNYISISFDEPLDNSKLISSSNNKPDLQITKVTKKGSIRYVFVKNVGKKVAGKNTLGIYIGKKQIKKVSVKSINAGKTLKVKVVIPKKYKNKVKTFKVDIRNVVKESNEKNNSFKAK